VIGAPGIQIGLEGESAGAAFVFEQSGSDWQFVSRLQSPQPQAFAGFGFSLAADAQRMVIGAFQDGPGQDASGTAYVYRASDRSLEATLRATNPQSGELMGISVAIAGDEIVLGASGFDLLNARSVGTAHVFERHDQVWNERAQVFPADPGAGDGFGRAVAIGDGLILLGAPAKSGANPLEGTVYVHTGGAVFEDGFE
jgi:hypothetical protein